MYTLDGEAGISFKDMLQNQSLSRLVKQHTKEVKSQHISKQR